MIEAIYYRNTCFYRDEALIGKVGTSNPLRQPRGMSTLVADRVMSLPPSKESHYAMRMNWDP